MGQYYRPSILKKNWKLAKNPVEATLSPYDFGNGAKLTEHSYIGNSFVNAMCYLLAGKYYGRPFVWCGDYANEVETRAGKHEIYFDAQRFIYKDYDNDNCDDKSSRYKKLLEELASANDDEYLYIINFTKKEYVRIPKYKPNKLVIHPLPLLCAAGNGRGGGDYWGTNEDYVGSWAFDRIGISNDRKAIRGFKRLDIIFKEEY